MDLKKLMNQSFFTRTISGIVLVAILLVAGILGGRVLYALSLFVSLIGVSEMLGVMKLQTTKLAYVAYFETVVYYVLLFFFQTEYTDAFILGGMMLILAIYVFTYPKYKTEEILLTFFSVVYAGVLMSFVYLLRTDFADGNIMIWLIFLGSWGCDTCAYLTGVTCGKHKMAPILSPKKSVEGGIGGVVGAILLGAIYGYFMRNHVSNFENPMISYAVICGVGALVSMVGDLAASAIKRNYEMKDYGQLIPGHGGILDRFDSVLFVAPFMYFLIQFMIG